MEAESVFNKLTQYVKISVYILLSWRGILTFGFCGLGVLLYFSIPWMPLQVLLARVIAVIFELSGYSVLQIRNYIMVEHVEVEIGSVCTYIHLILIGLPFMWRGNDIVRDILRMTLFAVLVSTANIARIYFAIASHARGLPWKYAHDYISRPTYVPIVILILLLWLTALKRRYEAQFKK